jgi:catechol 2,3-dioxygenase-like lactoylglutathione lyase family enzyme
MEAQVTGNDFPAPQGGFVLTRFLVVADQDRSREFYQSVFGARRDPDHAGGSQARQCVSQYQSQFLTEPKRHEREIRAYIRDPDGHLIEVGQSIARPTSPP